MSFTNVALIAFSDAKESSVKSFRNIGNVSYSAVRDLNPVAVLLQRALLELPRRWRGRAPVSARGAAGASIGADRAQRDPAGSSGRDDRRGVRRAASGVESHFTRDTRAKRLGKCRHVCAGNTRRRGIRIGVHRQMGEAHTARRGGRKRPYSSLDYRPDPQRPAVRIHRRN